MQRILLPRSIDPMASPRDFFLLATFVLGLGASTTTTWAAAPSIKRIFPAGAAAGSTADIELTGEFAAWPVELVCVPEGLTFEPQTESGKVRITIPAESPAGVYMLRAQNAEGFSLWKPFIVGRRTELIESEGNNEPSEAQQLPSSAIVINGRLAGRQDVDVFAVDLTAGQTLVVSAVANEILNSPMDMTVQVCDEHGFVLHQVDDERNLDPQLVFPVARTGRYLLRLCAFPSEPNSSIAFSSNDDYVYRVTVTTEAFVDHFLPLAIGRESTAEFQAIGWNVTAGALATLNSPVGPQVRVHDPSLAESAWLPFVDGPSLIADESASRESPQAIPVPATISGHLEAAGDIDTFRFSATANQEVRFEVTSRDLGFPLDAVLTIHDASGKKLSEVDDVRNRRDPRLEFKAPADGTYDLSIRDLHGQGGLRYAYRIDVNLPAPPFSFRSPNDAYVVARGGTVEILLDINRRRFDETVQFAAEGLPEGCVLSVPPSEKEGDSSKQVKATLTANCEPGIYHFRVLATSPSVTTPVAGSFNVAGIELEQMTVRVTE